MHVSIIGNGMIGKHLFAQLATANPNDHFTLVGNPYDRSLINDFKTGCMRVATSKGMEKSHLHEVSAQHPNVTLRRELHPNLERKVDFALVCVKTGVINARLAEQIKPILREDTPVALMVNGVTPWYGVSNHKDHSNELPVLSNYYAFKNALGGNPIVGGIVQYPVSPSPEHPELPHAYLPAEMAPLILGSAERDDVPQLAALKNLLDNAGMETKVTDKIGVEVFNKLAINMMNPVAGGFESTVGKVFGDHRLSTVYRHALGELYEIASTVIPSHNWSDKTTFMDSVMERFPKNHPSHPTSMGMDLQQGRRTEKETLVEALVEIGQANGIETPTLKALYDIVNVAEKVCADRAKGQEDDSTIQAQQDWDRLRDDLISQSALR